ncbi:MAG: hypothetical protein P1V20_15315 [Verrucomicrobiales bacterium]|nr:hypothetical protein [Verrucomicrobiales bacterium]
MRRVYCTFAMVFFAGTFAPASAQLQSGKSLLHRTWTSSEGVKIEGEVTVFEGETVSLKTSKGFFRITMDKLDQADQNFIRKNAPPEIISAPEKSASKNGVLLRTDSRKSYKGSYKVTVGGSTVRNNATLRQVYTNIYLVVPFGYDITRLRLMSDAGKEVETKIPEFPVKELESFFSVWKKNEPILRDLKEDAVTPQQDGALKELIAYIESQRDIARGLKWDPAVERESKPRSFIRI